MEEVSVAKNSKCKCYLTRPLPIFATQPKQVGGKVGKPKTWQQQGIGEILMVEAMQWTLLNADNSGVIGLFGLCCKKNYNRYP